MCCGKCTAVPGTEPYVVQPQDYEYNPWPAYYFETPEQTQIRLMQEAVNALTATAKELTATLLQIKEVLEDRL